MKEYAITCNREKNLFAETLGTRIHLVNSVNLYSLTDLLELHSGDLFDILKKTRDRWTAHFKKCDLCLAKRQLCIICDDAPFYPAVHVGIISIKHVTVV